VNTHLDGFTAANALDIVCGYDVVLDATDNPATRYLIKWVCIIVRKFGFYVYMIQVNLCVNV